MADNPELKRFAETTGILNILLEITSGMLWKLPIPIGIPRGRDTLSMTDLDTARRVLRDEPIPADVKALLLDAVLSLMIAIEITVLVTTNGLAPWRIDALELAAVRITGQLNTAGMMMPGLLPDDDDDDEENIQ
jgi:hypothetical protein